MGIKQCGNLNGCDANDLWFELSHPTQQRLDTSHMCASCCQIDCCCQSLRQIIIEATSPRSSKSQKSSNGHSSPKSWSKGWPKNLYPWSLPLQSVARMVECIHASTPFLYFSAPVSIFAGPAPLPSETLLFSFSVKTLIYSLMKAAFVVRMSLVLGRTRSGRLSMINALRKTCTAENGRAR